MDGDQRNPKAKFNFSRNEEEGVDMDRFELSLLINQDENSTDDQDYLESLTDMELFQEASERLGMGGACENCTDDEEVTEGGNDNEMSFDAENPEDFADTEENTEDGNDNEMSFDAEDPEDFADTDDGSEEEDDQQENEDDQDSSQRTAFGSDDEDGSPEQMVKGPEDNNPAVRTSNEDDGNGDGLNARAHADLPTAFGAVRAAQDEDRIDGDVDNINPDILPQDGLVRTAQDEDNQGGAAPQQIVNPKDPGVITRSLDNAGQTQVATSDLKRSNLEINVESVQGVSDN